MVTAADGVCTHLRMLPLVVVPRDGDGDFERGGEVKSRGCWRVDTMVCGVVWGLFWCVFVCLNCLWRLSVVVYGGRCEKNRAWRC